MPQTKRFSLKTAGYSRSIEKHLLDVYERASVHDLHEGYIWYQCAHDTAEKLANRYGVTLEIAAGVIAALSPGRNWTLNVIDAEEFIKAYTLGARGRKLPIVGTYGRKNVNKSIRILKGEHPLDVLGGAKVRSFYSNILDPENESPVTIDRHAKCAALGLKSSENSLVKNSEYEYLAEHYRRAAAKVELIPNQFQAIVWVVWRRLDGNLNQFDLELEEVAA